MASILVVTRIHNLSSSHFPSTESLLMFVDACKSYATHILVCVGSKDASVTLEYVSKASQIMVDNKYSSFVSIECVHPWGNFVSALNSSIINALSNGFDKIIFQSLEYRTTKRLVDHMLHYFLEDPALMVIGPVMPGHIFQIGSHVINGRNIPWNTFAIWHTAYLGLTGFPLVGDGGPDPIRGGVEEVTAISLLQLINVSYRALLIQFCEENENNEANWDTAFEDLVRQNYHDRKMASKIERPAQQMAALSIPFGTVTHISHA